ncbi:hypothetical protein [Accumulibacter sp.]|uniref:hypothetical protein n=1 Tax=Accumulibacter sp. TaxID=2053492 RepID=UPI0035AEDAD0
MTTSSRTSSNKSALRASLKKEDDSLAGRLAAADAPLEATIQAAPVESEPAAGAAAVTAPSTRARRAAARPAAAKAPAARAAATTRKAPVQAPAVDPAAAPKARPASRKVAATGAEPRTRAAKPVAGTVEMLEKVAKQKRDKLVSYSVKLLKSEEAAIEALRDELSRVAGWAATKSDILRAGIQVFAEQKLEQMQALLGSLAAPVKAGKKDKKAKNDTKKKKR